MKYGPVPSAPIEGRGFTLTPTADAGELKLRDVSSEGVLVEANLPPPSGSKVHLHYEASVIDASVAWSDGNWFGLRFDRRLTGGPLLERVFSRLKVSAPRQYRQGIVDDAD